MLGNLSISKHDNDDNVRMVIVMAERRWLVSTLMKPMCKVRYSTLLTDVKNCLRKANLRQNNTNISYNIF
jgi:predicted glycosyl hydrolase (DUF1957 family)